jgi:hypothetical protein
MEKSQWFSKQSIILILVFQLLAVGSLWAGTLKGTVKGKGGRPKKYIQLDFSGPQRVVVYSNNKGEYSITLRGGRYMITVRQRSRTMKFTVTIPSGNKTKIVDIPVNW